VLVGRPNVGKSSLLNMLLAEPRAIVAPIPGTTRDVIEEAVQIAGVAFRLADTAGLRRAGSALEEMGMALTKERIAQADIVLAVFDNAAPFTSEDADVLALTKGKKSLAVLNKSDLRPLFPVDKLQGLPVVCVSALTGAGKAQLNRAMVELAGIAPLGESPGLVTRPRQVGALQGVAAAVQRAVTGKKTGVTADCLALELEDALWHLGELTGETARDEVIDEIFSRFCVGK